MAVVDLLINLGANLTYSQEEFGTPLMLAIHKNRLATAKLLIKRGAIINEVPWPLGTNEKLFRSIIHIAIYSKSPELVKLLLDHGAVTDWDDAFEVAEKYSSLFMLGYLEHPSFEVSELIKEKRRQESLVRN